MITEDYVSLETAKLLKKKGFDEICRAFWKEWAGHTTLCHCGSGHGFEHCYNSILKGYNDDTELNVAAPTLGMAMKWLREIHKISIVIAPSSFMLDTGNCSAWTYTIWYGYNIERHIEFDTYEEACEAAIKYCLENLI